MQEILNRMLAVAEDPCASLAEWKRNHNKKIIGCLPMHFPEEIIHAAGALPVVIPESEEPITIGHAHIHTYICGYVRSCIDIALKGKLSFLDGWVFPDTCHSIRGMSGIIKRNISPPYYKPLFLPGVLKSPHAKEFMLDELGQFKADLGKFLDCEISDESLRESVIVFNKNRALLRQLYDLRRTRPGGLSAKHVQAIVTASMFMPKEEHSELLERLLATLEDRDISADGRIKLIISGSLCEPVDGALLDLVEQLGAVVVDDDLYIGSRYFITDAEPVDSPLEAIANRYLNMLAPCPTRVDIESDWGGYLVEMVGKAEAQGVINIIVKYCEPHCFYYPQVRKKLAEAGIPELLLETEHEKAPLGQYRTRLEAFLEIIEGKAEQGGQ